MLSTMSGMTHVYSPCNTARCPSRVRRWAQPLLSSKLSEYASSPLRKGALAHTSAGRVRSSENCERSGDSVRIRECSSEGQALLTEALCLLIVGLTQSNPCQVNESGNHAQTVSCRAACMQAAPRGVRAHHRGYTIARDPHFPVEILPDTRRECLHLLLIGDLAKLIAATGPWYLRRKDTFFCQEGQRGLQPLDSFTIVTVEVPERPERSNEAQGTFP